MLQRPPNAIMLQQNTKKSTCIIYIFDTGSPSSPQAWQSKSCNSILYCQVYRNVVPKKSTCILSLASSSRKISSSVFPDRPASATSRGFASPNRLYNPRCALKIDHSFESVARSTEARPERWLCSFPTCLPEARSTAAFAAAASSLGLSWSRRLSRGGSELTGVEPSILRLRRAECLSKLKLDNHWVFPGLLFA